MTDFVNKTKLTEIGNKIIVISNLARKTALTAVENKIPNVSNFVKKIDYSTKVTDIENKLNNHNHEKYIDTPEFNKLSVDVLNAQLVQANLVTKPDFDGNCRILTEKLLKIKQIIYLFKMN